MIDIAQASKIAEKLAGLESLARRVGQSVPEWLEAVWNVLRSGGRDETLKPFSDFAQYTDSLFRDFELQSNHADPDCVLSVLPSEQLSLILETLKIVWRQGGTPQNPNGQSPILSRMQVALLRDVAQAMKNAADGAMDWHLQDKKDSLRLPVILVFEDTPGQECGCVAQLQLQLWHCPGANMGFVQSPSQMCTPTTLRFSQSLETVSHWLRNTITHETVRDYALVWDLIPKQGAYHLLSGASASATFALGALWLLKEFSLPPWRSALWRLQQADFNKLYLSAELLPNGELAVVGGLVPKNKSLGLVREALGDSFGISLPLHVAKDQWDVKLLGDHLPLVLRRHDTLLGVVQSAVARPMNAAQESLYNALQTALSELNTPPQTTPSPYPLHEPPSVSKEASWWVSALTLSDRDTRRAVSDLAHYALDRWAFRGKSSGSGMAGAWRGGQVHQRFVNLRLQWPRQSGQCESFLSLEHLMAACDPGQSKYDDNPKSAYLVVGEPGSGKTWLMARHEQALCEQFLWQEVHGGDDSTELPVLPLYLPLNLLPGDKDPVAFFRDWLSGEYPDPSLGLVQLLDANPGNARFRLRLLLDGLNEIKTRDGVDQTERAKEVVIRLWQAFGRPKLPIVIGVRPGRHWQLDDLARNFSVGEVLLDRWKRQDIQTYLERRWGQGDARVQKFMEELRPDSPHEALLGVPLYLNIQCELVEAGAQKLLSNRTHLLSAMLWVRLMQELAKNEGHFTLKDMVSVDEKNFAQDFYTNPGYPPEFPRQGWLLKGLFAQAKAQWLWDPKVDVKARGQVSVFVTEVQKTLKDVGIPDDACESWFKAVSDLGLGQRYYDRNHGRHQFQFQHQVFGEWLASQQIFYSSATLRHEKSDAPPHPADWPTEALECLANELAPPQLERGCMDELESQAREADAIWETPGLKFLLEKWLRDGLTVKWQVIEEQMPAEYLGDQDDSPRSLLREIGVLKEAHREATATWNFARLGDLYFSRLTLPTLDSSRDWHEQVSAWRFLLIGTHTWSVFQNEAQRQIAEQLGSEGSDKAARLWQATGHLPVAPPGALDEIVLLALEALPDPLPWLLQLLKFAKNQGQGSKAIDPTHQKVLPVGCWALLSCGLLQEAQRLDQLHQGSKDLKKLRRESAKLLLAVNQALDPELQAQDISDKKPGYDLRHRIQAGLCLGRQGALGSDAGDHIRFERIGSAAQGVRLKRDYWCKINPRDKNVRPFFIARYPVTVGEYQAFVLPGGYADADAPWWLQGLSKKQSAARAWLLHEYGKPKPSNRIPGGLIDERFNNPLQPMVGVNWYEANAFTYWAEKEVYADWLAPLSEELKVDDDLTLRLPTEREWVAALHGVGVATESWPGHTGDGDPSALLFNHHATGLGLTTPVGSFPASQSVNGVMDACGHQWEWCANAYSEDESDRDVHTLCAADFKNDQTRRALRGGSFFLPASECRVSSRNKDDPHVRSVTKGFRLVLAVER